jgi:TRAP-type C4-dicarboxylate transport system substrate-binding protein
MFDALLSRVLVGAALAALAGGVSAQAGGPDRAEPPAPLTLRVVGGLAGLNQYTRHEAPFWTAALPQLTQGRVRAEITPFDRAGIRGQDMLRLMQLGVVPFGTALLSLSGTRDALLAAPDLAGLNPDIAHLRRHTQALRPVLAALLRQRYGIELLALYIYPAQMLFCTQPLSGLHDLAGRRIRVSGTSQADWVEALGAVAVPLPFASLKASLAQDGTDCAITGSMSGHTIGLHQVTHYLHTLPISWGMALFGANAAAWAALPAQARQVLSRQLPQLEAAIWEESERETAEGVACNVGRPACRSGAPGDMVEVPATPQDRQARQALLQQQVLPRWLQRCGPACAATWNQHIVPVGGPPVRPAAPAKQSEP